jgi:4-hydroxy-tetrahydrodipicolinate synthase
MRLFLPLPGSTPPEHRAKIEHAARALLALAQEFAQANPSY